MGCQDKHFASRHRAYHDPAFSVAGRRNADVVPAPTFRHKLQAVPDIGDYADRLPWQLRPPALVAPVYVGQPERLEPPHAEAASKIVKRAASKSVPVEHHQKLPPHALAVPGLVSVAAQTTPSRLTMSPFIASCRSRRAPSSCSRLRHGIHTSPCCQTTAACGESRMFGHTSRTETIPWVSSWAAYMHACCPSSISRSGSAWWRARARPGLIHVRDCQYARIYLLHAL